MSQIVYNTPGWVWGLLASLIGLGLAQVPARRVTAVVVCILPIAIIASTAFALLAAFGFEIGVAAIGFSAALAGFAINTWGLRSPRGVVWDEGLQTFLVPGSWLPLGLILIIFSCRFAIGVAKATMADVAGSTGFMVAICTIMGVCCGILVSRAWTVIAAGRAGHGKASASSA